MLLKARNIWGDNSNIYIENEERELMRISYPHLKKLFESIQWDRAERSDGLWIKPTEIEIINKINKEN